MKTIAPGVRRLLLILLMMSSMIADAGTLVLKGTLRKKSDCKDSGICRADTDGDDPTLTTFSLTMDPSQSGLLMKINDDQFTDLPFVVSQNLGLGRFIMAEPYTFSYEISRSLGYPAAVTVPAGNYTVTHANSEYTIALDIDF